MKEQENYIKNYYSKTEHDLTSILKIDNADSDKKIASIKKEMNKLAKEIEQKGIELSNEVSKLYSQKFIPIKEDIVVHYNSYNYNGGEGYFDLNTGLIYDDFDNDHITYSVDKKIGEISVVVGYDYDLASVIVRTYKYTISRDNSKMNTKLLSESVISFLESKNATIYFNGEDGTYNGEIRENTNCNWNITSALRKVENHDFVNTLFGVNYEGRHNLEDLRDYYQSNKAFEIIIKTSPKEIMDDLLELRDIEKPLPIYKLIGVSLDTYNTALERGTIKELFKNRLYINGTYGEKYGINKTEKEWLDYIEEIKNYQEDLDFYNIDYTQYYRNDNGLLDTILTNYSERKVLRDNYTLGKFTNYVVNETINQGYDRVRDFIGELADYLDMCQEEEIKPTLYSSYLRQTHDIARRNHKVVVEQENEKIFKERYKDFKEYNGKKYNVVAPTCSNDLKKEGDNLNHCVASYIKRVIDGDCLIYFLRKDKKESLITFEVRHNTIVQVRGLHNRKPTRDEMDALKDFAKYRKMETNY